MTEATTARRPARACAPAMRSSGSSGEGDRRWVLRDLESGTFLRLSGRRREAVRAARRLALAGRADRRSRAAASAPAARRGSRGCSPTSASAACWPACERRPAGAGRAAEPAAAAAARRARRRSPGLGALRAPLPRAAAGCCSRRPALIALGVLAAAGVGVFAYLVVGPLRHAVRRREQIGLGGARVPRSGGFASWRCTSWPTGYMASYGRRVAAAGLKLMLVFPYAFVDTSEAWFEPRRRRIAISAAGPASRLHARRRCSRSAACGWRRRHRARHLLPARVRGVRRRVLQPQPVARPRRLPHPRRRAARAGAAAARARAVRAAAGRAPGRRRLAGARPLLAVRHRWSMRGGAVRGRDDTALSGHARGVRARRLDRLGADGGGVDRGVPAGGLRGRPAAGAAGGCLAPGRRRVRSPRADVSGAVA